MPSDSAFTIELYEYAKKIHGKVRASEIKATDNDLRGFLKSIISSHDHLRTLNLECNETRLKNTEAERRAAFEFAKQFALEQNWFSRERLRAMTVGELADLLHDDEN